MLKMIALPKAILVLIVLAAAVSGSFLPMATAQGAPDARFFPETGHNVGSGFLAFFDSHGGLDIFGYPLTEEIQEGGRLVQYFQRQRMELWPENPEPYNVQLSLLGDLLLGPGSPPIAADQIPGAGATQRRYFPETGHTISFDFRDFFESRGGLDTFGYPTTEEVMEDGLTVQHFQRARLEWHPENPPPYQVQLSLLGEKYLARLGIASGIKAQAEGPVALNLGGKLVFQTSSGGDIYVVRADGTGLIRVGRGIDPALSFDGQHIAYISWDYPAGLYVMNTDGGGPRQVLQAEGLRAPACSPDGSRIALYEKYPGFYRRPDPSGVMVNMPEDLFKILEVDLASGRLSSRPSDAHSFSPTWSPDGNVVAFAGEQGLYLASDDGRASLIPGTDARYASPAWSPDGTRIAYMWKQHDHWEIGVMPAGGGGNTLLTSSPLFSEKPANNVAPAWSPAGTQIAFLSDREGPWRIYIMDADGGNQHRLTDMAVDYQFAQERAVSWSR
ncbi:MAG: hypothetical protein Q8R28_01630 [Dehalococcoidia bacterium]|nr:hypothetical protein [Dehalococcoidia bacterium]